MKEKSSDTPQESRRPPVEQLRVDLLNAFYTAFKSDVDHDVVREHIEETMEMAAEDADVELPEVGGTHASYEGGYPAVLLEADAVDDTLEHLEDAMQASEMTLSHDEVRPSSKRAAIAAQDAYRTFVEAHPGYELSEDGDDDE